jgi:phosphohistidine phosphatase
MKYLTVLRHAKSSWDHPGMSDHDRPLNDRGKRAAEAIPRFLWKTYFGGQGEPLLPAPNKIIASTSARTLATAQALRTVFGLPIESLQLVSALYLAPDDVILDTVQFIDEDIDHCVLIAHNPGLHDFCNRLLARNSVTRMVTCTAVILGLPIEYWGLADWEQAELIAYITPRTLEKRFPLEYAGLVGEDGDD